MMTNFDIFLHCVKLSISTQSFDLAECSKRLYSSHDARALCDAPESAITLCVEREDSIHALDIDMPPFLEGSKGSLGDRTSAVFAETNICASPCYYREGRFYSINDGDYRHRLVYDLATQTLRANLGGRYLECDQWVISNLVRPFLQSFLLPFHGMMSLHGAVLAKGDRTIFLYGNGGAGKSTTTIGLMRSGWDLLSDDGPFFVSSQGRVCALSSLDYLHVTGNTLRLFPELASHVVGGEDYREKFAISRKDLLHGAGPSTPRPITHFLRLDRRPVSAPSFAPIERSTVLKTLLNEGMIIFRMLPDDAYSAVRAAYSRFVLEIVSGVSRSSLGYDVTFANKHLADLSPLIEALPIPEAQ